MRSLFIKATVAAAGVAAGLLSLVPSVQAVTFTEVGDAGQLLGAAQEVGPSVNTVSGAISFGGDIDLFKLLFDVATTVTFDGIANDSDSDSDSDFDPNLHLFNAVGNPLAADDDGGIGLNSRIIFNIFPGIYYLAIGDNNIEATDAFGMVISDNDAGVLNPNGVLGGWSGSGTTSSSLTGTYELKFSTATAAGTTPIPTPALLPGLIGMGVAALRKKGQEGPAEQEA